MNIKTLALLTLVVAGGIAIAQQPAASKPGQPPPDPRIDKIIQQNEEIQKQQAEILKQLADIQAQLAVLRRRSG